MQVKRIATLALGLFWLSTRALGHEMWIEPRSFSTPVGEPLVAELKVGQNLNGARLPYLTHEIIRFDIANRQVIEPYQGTYGDLPALRWMPNIPGLHTLIYQSAPSTLRYRNVNKFDAFAVEKGYDGLAQQHQALWPEQPVVEQYTRYAKSLVAVGAAAGQDRAQGLLIEFVIDALAGPTDEVRGRLMVHGKPYPNHQVTLINRQAARSRARIRPDLFDLPRVFPVFNCWTRYSSKRPASMTRLGRAIGHRRPSIYRRPTRV